MVNRTFRSLLLAAICASVATCLAGDEKSADELWAATFDRPEALSAVDHPVVVFLYIEHAEIVRRGLGKLAGTDKEHHAAAMRKRFAELSGLDCLVVHASELDGDELERPQVKAVLISGRTTTDVRPNDERLYNFIRTTRIPMMGLCGGCQLIGNAFGTPVVPLRRLNPGEADPSPGYHPGVFKEIGFLRVRVEPGDPLFAGLPAEIVVRQSHAFQLADVPRGFELLASTPDCRVQAIRHRERCVYGVQFHPENYDDEHSDGRTVLENFFRLAAAGEPVTLAARGQARFPVVVGPGAGERVRVAAGELAEYLGRIGDAEFAVEQGDGSRGLAVGVFTDFPGLGLAERFDPAELSRREEYLLRSHPHGVCVIGATEGAVEHAVWDLLHRLGYRQFFPTETWEIVPRLETVDIALDVTERPDFYNRSGPRGAGRTVDRAAWQRWHRRNRMTPAFTLNTGHSYGGIIRRNRAAFDAHPEFYALVDGRREYLGADTKFCIANPGLRELVVADAVNAIRQNPDQETISLDPSDGANWCQCDACAAMGGVSDRVVLLANEAAAAVNALGLGEKYVGIYAYNMHSPPPAVDVHPNVVVSIATSFIRGGYTVEQLIEGWSARARIIGIREYHDVHTWSRDLPRRARGGDLRYLTEKIPYFHARGARFMNSENADSWGANGLGYWLSPILLWDVGAAERVDEYVDDFLEKSFGAAREPMREFYELLNRDRTPRSNEDLLARMYRHVAEARALTDDPAVRARLDDLALYTRYVELYLAYDDAGGSARQAAFEEVVRFAYRIRNTLMVTARSTYTNVPYRDRAVSVPDEFDWSVPEERNAWKSSEPFGDEEISALLRAGVRAHQPTVLDFEPVEYSRELVPAAAALGGADVSTGSFGTFRGRHAAYTWLRPEKKELSLRVTGGLIAHYRDRGNVRLSLVSLDAATREPVAVDDSVPPDGNERRVVLRSSHGGLHRLEWSDGGDRTSIVWPENHPMTMISSLEEPASPAGRWTLCFYVPRGTKTIGGFSSATSGVVVDGDGNAVLRFDDLGQPGYFRVPVPAGQDGRLWRFENCTGQRLLMTVPPCLARNAKELLLPREVVDADSLHEE